MKYSYYPGCSLHATAAEYDHSTKMVCEKLGITLQELEEWNCCGSSSAHSTNQLASIAIPASTLITAEKAGMDVVAPCAACYQRLATAEYEMKHDASVKAKVEKVLGAEYKGTVSTKSILEVIIAEGMEKIAQTVKKPLQGLKIACYYGCYLVKPQKICHVDDPENPMIMDNIFRTMGAETLDWPYKTECCGGSLSFSNLDSVLKLLHDILQFAQDGGANCIVTPCPMCQPNLDMRQAAVNRKYGTNFDLPVFYFTELMALGFGYNKADLELNKHYVNAKKVLEAF